MLSALPLEYLTAAGVVIRVVFPPREYRSATADDPRSDPCRDPYETARLLPRGDDGGFAEAFLKARHTADT